MCSFIAGYFILLQMYESHEDKIKYAETGLSMRLKLIGRTQRKPVVISSGNTLTP